MRVLLVKTSSLGDVLHALPALTDAARALPHARFDWVIEESYAEIPSWHPAIDTVIPVALRRWRHGIMQPAHRSEFLHALRILRARSYDRIVDAQGLIKSAVLTACARGEHHGFGFASAREPLAALFYRHRHAVAPGSHAVLRLRRLFALALGYELPSAEVDYGISRALISFRPDDAAYLVFLHGTAWPTKQWPERYWKELAGLANEAGLRVLLPAGNRVENDRAHRIAASATNARVLPPMTLTQLAGVLAGAQGAVGVDTGLAHCAAALSVPAVTIYGATNPGLTGTLGEAQRHARADFACSPCLRRICRYRGNALVEPACYQTVAPSRVWDMMTGLLGAASRPGS
ncbi:MAG: lipopolysaccharide heptosyltransferase I [Gammaproteobacteria bacterium]|nr:lipopolysaccharide heptosyltransferase I [Gammaproteobacteria bacterium]